MFCPYCHKNAARVIKGDLIYCANCDGVVEDNSPSRTEKPTLRCPKCDQYSRNDYCRVCGYEFKPNIDY